MIFRRVQVYVQLWALLGSYCVAVTQAHAQDDWFDMPQRNYEVTAHLGGVNDGSVLYGASAHAPLPFSLEFGGQLTQLESDEGDESSYRLYINTNPFSRFIFSVSTFDVEREKSYSLRDIEISAGVHFRRILLRASLMRGRLDVAPDSISPAIRSRFKVGRYLSSDREALGLSIDYLADHWSVQMAYTDYEMSRNNELVLNGSYFELDTSERRELLSSISVSDSSRVMRQRVRGARTLNGTYNQQESIFSDKELALNILFTRGNIRYTTGLISYENIGSNTSEVNMYGGMSFDIKNDFSVGMLLSSATEDASIYSELSIGYRW